MNDSIKINCDSLVHLKNLKEVSEINAEVLDYKVNDGALNGNVLVTGKYLKDDGLIYEFNDCIPFTIMMKNGVEFESVSLSDVESEKLSEEQIKVKFNLNVNYIEDDKEEIYEAILDNLDKQIDEHLFERNPKNEEDFLDLTDSFKTYTIIFK